MDIIAISQALAYVVLYSITGFGPGFFLGIFVGNIVGARGQPSITDKYTKNLKDAATHNAQWHPSHNKWHKD